MTRRTDTLVRGPKGHLAREEGGMSLPLQVLQSHRGWYLGTMLDDQPYSRESNEYWQTRKEADEALASDGENWSQRDHL